MYNNSYDYNPQMTVDKINAQMNELERMKQQLQQPVQQPSINQTFQLSSINNNIKYANNIDEVIKEPVFNETPFFSKDLSQMWLKNSKGDIRIFEINEVIKKDDKDLVIESLQMQIEELRKEIRQNAKSDDEYINATNQSSKSTDVSTTKTNARKTK